MKKQIAIDMLGGTPKKAATALGYESVQAVYMWPEDLPQALADRVSGAANRIARELAQAPDQQWQTATQTVA